MLLADIGEKKKWGHAREGNSYSVDDRQIATHQHCFDKRINYEPIQPNFPSILHCHTHLIRKCYASIILGSKISSYW
jgi:hypothetical protein